MILFFCSAPALILQHNIIHSRKGNLFGLFVINYQEEANQSIMRTFHHLLLVLTAILAMSKNVAGFAPPKDTCKSKYERPTATDILQEQESPSLSSPSPLLAGNAFRSKSYSALSAFGRDDDPDDINVNVNEVPNIDAVTLTAVGFGAIAFNFLVLANMGDAGIAGLVARIINSF